MPAAPDVARGTNTATNTVAIPYPMEAKQVDNLETLINIDLSAKLYRESVMRKTS
jgi:hypothetical protein